MADSVLLQLERVESGYGRARALHGIDLMVRPGEAAGTAVLLVEQNAMLAFAATSRAYVIENGLVSREGASEALRQDPAIRTAYLGF